MAGNVGWSVTSSASVAHAGVLHPQDRRVLGGGEAAVDDVADDEGVAAAVDRGPHLAVEPADRPVQDRRPRPRLTEREAAEGALVGDVLHRLGVLADDRPASPAGPYEPEDGGVADQSARRR